MTDLSELFSQIASLDRASTHTDNRRKQEGVTYTPPAIVRAMVALLDPQWHETIHEPSCGRGMFAFALVEHWMRQGKPAHDIAKWAAEKLFLCDIDKAAIDDLRQLWTGFFQKQGVPHANLNAQCSDGLFGVYSQQHFDVIIGNPPYVRIQHLSEEMRSKIRERFPACQKGNVDLYYAFFEDALQRATRACYIMPNSWFSNRSAKALRQAAKPKVQALVDFGAHLVFAPVRAYTAIVLTGNCALTDPIRVRGSLPKEGEPWKDIPRNDARWSEDTWTPLLDRNAQAGATLGDHAEVVSGIATLSDKSYLLPNPCVVEKNRVWFVEQVDPDFPEHTLRVPIELAPRLIKATRATELGLNGPRILCPYDGNWKLVDEATLRDQAPDLLAWLERRRASLDGRDKGKTQEYEAWYAYGRRQGFWTPQDDEVVLLVPQMGNGKLASVRVDLKGTRGRFLFTSGYVLRPKDAGDLARIEGQLGSSEAWAFVQREGKAWAGQGDYRTIGARALRKMTTSQKSHVEV